MESDVLRVYLRLYELCMHARQVQNRLTSCAAHLSFLQSPPPLVKRNRRYRFALQDVRTVLSMPHDKVGSQNLALANGMQHRLNRVVQQLKNAS